MASKLTSYYPPKPIQSSLLKKPPPSVPPTDELQALQKELKGLRELTLARSKKAGEDLKTLEESMRRMKEKEKGKAKAIEKIKRERDFTPSLDDDSLKPINSFHGISSKPRPSPHPAASLPGSARSSVDPRRPSIDELKKKKKKRKFEEDSDMDSEPRSRKSPPVMHPPVHVPTSKAPKPIVPTQPSAKPQAGPDFSMPPVHPPSLLSPRPPVQPTPIPGPSKPTEVMDDFSKLKQPTQTAVSTFYTSIDPWIRPIREEDVGFLEHTGDEVEPFIMPKLGRHYLEVWDDQDAGLIPPPIGSATAYDPLQASSYAPPAPKWDPSQLAEQDLVGEEKGHGPLTERVISALLPLPDPSGWKGVKAAEDAMEGRPGGSGAAAARKEKLNVSELEGRIRDTMRAHGLLDGQPDYTERVDDPIATALRKAQQDLRIVLATNKARKLRLVAIAKDRLAYQEYIEGRDALDRAITTLYAKLQKKDNPKLNKKKKKLSDVSSADLNGTPALPGPAPAAMGLNPDDELKLHVNEQLKHLVETRRKWVDEFGGVLEAEQRKHPGRYYDFPHESVFAGIEDEVSAILNSLPPPTCTGPPMETTATSGAMVNGVATVNGKGKMKEEDASDEMDVG